MNMKLYFVCVLYVGCLVLGGMCKNLSSFVILNLKGLPDFLILDFLSSVSVVGLSVLFVS